MVAMLGVGSVCTLSHYHSADGPLQDEASSCTHGFSDASGVQTRRAVPWPPREAFLLFSAFQAARPPQSAMHEPNKKSAVPGRDTSDKSYFGPTLARSYLHSADLLWHT